MKTDGIPRPCVCTSIRKAARVLARTYDGALAPSGMNVTQLAVMRALLRHPHEPLARVAEDLAMDRTSLYRAIEALRKQRWVTLSDGNDSRSRSAAITKSGALALKRGGPGLGEHPARHRRALWLQGMADLHERTATPIDCAAPSPPSASTTGRRP